MLNLAYSHTPPYIFAQTLYMHSRAGLEQLFVTAGSQLDYNPGEIG